MVTYGRGIGLFDLGTELRVSGSRVTLEKGGSRSLEDDRKDGLNELN